MLPIYYGRRSNGGSLTRYVFDEGYVRRLAGGDPEIEAHFSSYFGDLLLIKLRSRLRSPQLIEDARQETFVRVLLTVRKKGGIEHPERLGAFVNSVCENVLFEFFRSSSRLAQMEEYAPECADSRASAESEFITEERKAQVRSTLYQLPESDRKLLRSVFFEERDKDEICRELQIDRDYLRVRVHRALGRFRAAVIKGRDHTRRLKGGAA